MSDGLLRDPPVHPQEQLLADHGAADIHRATASLDELYEDELRSASVIVAHGRGAKPRAGPAGLSSPTRLSCSRPRPTSVRFHLWEEKDSNSADSAIGG
jgi:hypothetical protein